MTERLLQYIWQMQYFNKTSLHTASGETLQIVHPGKHNQNQGPDFLEASIKIDNTRWAGSIEIHLKASHWNAHQHHTDKNYSNVILHVVWQQDADIDNPNEIPVLILGDRIPKLLIHQYEELMHNSSHIPCRNSINAVAELVWTAWLERLLIERLKRKTETIQKHLLATNNHWEEIFWWTIARNFGVTVNAEAFEAIAQSTSITVLAKHKNQIHQLESILLGQAGLLHGHFADAYPQLLQKEYRFLKQKYQLQSIPLPIHFLRMRPPNFPTIRLAQLAQLIHHSSHLFSKIKDTPDVETVKKLLQVTANDYWHYHYRFDEAGEYREKTLGKQMVENIIINTVVPVLFAYGHIMNEPGIKEKAVDWLQQMPSEKNKITEKWATVVLVNNTAADSQALTELTKNYCIPKNCLNCAIGNNILKRKLD